MRCIWPGLVLAAIAAQGADALTGARHTVVTTTVQTGFADTFQLTLGGVFGQGPAWQNRVTFQGSNVFRAGDAVTLAGFATTDLASAHKDWSAALGYRTRVWHRGSQSLLLGASVERWRFPSVRTGTQDWVTGYNATYGRTLFGVPLTVQSQAWTLLQSDLQRGTLVHTISWFSHPLYESRHMAVTLRHGPQHTYSWGVYGTHGNRVVRYAGTLVLTHGRTSLECGYRQQLGLQPGIPDNRLWSAMLSRTF